MGRLPRFGRFLHDFDHAAGRRGMSRGFSQECGKFRKKCLARDAKGSTDSGIADAAFPSD